MPDAAQKALDAAVRLAETVADYRDADARVSHYTWSQDRPKCLRAKDALDDPTCFDLAMNVSREGYLYGESEEALERRADYEEAWHKAETCPACGPLVTAVRDRRAAKHRRAHARRALALIGRAERRRRNKLENLKEADQ